MPRKFDAPANSITDQQLLPDLRHKIKGRSAIQVYHEVAEDLSLRIEAGENIESATLCYVNANKLYKASNKLADFYTATGGQIGEMVKCIENGIVEYEADSNVLFNNAGNLSSTPGTIFIQEVATRISDEKIYINIQHGWYTEN